MMCSPAQEIMAWTELHLVTLSARYIPGRNNIIVDQLSHPDQVLPTEWSILPQVCDAICEVFSHPHMDFFATRENMKLPLHVTVDPEPMVWKQDAFQYP